MASIFKRSGSGAWIITWFDHTGRRREKSSRTTDKRAAERIASKLEADTALRREGVIDAKSERIAAAAQRPIKELLEDYLEHCKHAGQVKDHVACKRTHLLSAVQHIGCARLQDLDATSVERFLQHLLTLGKAPRTVNVCRSALLSFMNWCESSGLVAENQLRRLPIQEIAGKRRRVRRGLTHDELAKLLETASDQDTRNGDRWGSRAAVYCTAAFTGLRRNELRHLRWDDVDFDHQVLHVRAEVAKARRAAVLPLHPDVAAALKAIKAKDAKPLDPVFRTMPTAKTFREDLQRAGIERRDSAGRVVDLHALRTTLGTELARQGVAPQVAQMLMRHSDYRITMEHYVTLGLAETKAAIGKLRGTASQSSKPDQLGGGQEAQTQDLESDTPSRFPSTHQQIPQQLEHSEVPSGASGCDSELTAQQKQDVSNSLSDDDLCDLVPAGATGGSGTPGRN